MRATLDGHRSQSNPVQPLLDRARQLRLVWPPGLVQVGVDVARPDEFPGRRPIPLQRVQDLGLLVRGQ
eukprot:11174529-Lingulodinium_polyedra.AAC.1